MVYDKQIDCFIGYVDSNYIEDLDHKRSIRGYLFDINGYTIS